MSGITASQSRRTSPLMSVAVHCLVVPLPCATGDDGKPVRLLPRRRLTTAILPIVGGATGATSSGNDLGGGILGKLGCEGHGQTIHRKNKSAMPKIILVIRRQCRHITRMSNTKTQYRVAFMSWDNVNGNCVQKEFSTQWYEAIDQCDKWMHEIGARIVTREYTPEPFPWKHYLGTVGAV